MSERLKGRVALVTAAGQGIGRAIAQAFLNEGASVHATDLDLAKLDGLDTAQRHKLDVLSTADVEGFVRKLGARPARSTSSSTAPASSITARSSIATTRPGTFPSTSMSARCTA